MTYQTPFSEADLALMSEALHRLLAVKQEAFQTVNEALRKIKREAFHPRDFAIPQIQKLIGACADMRGEETDEAEVQHDQ